jgi:hypothetical protein
MNALDLTQVRLIKFNWNYALLGTIYLLIASVIENRFFKNADMPFTSGIFLGLSIQFCILNLRIILMQRKFKYSGEIQIGFAFLSIIINFGVLIFLLYSVNNFSLIFGFFIAHNLNILNIALITNLSVKKND